MSTQNKNDSQDKLKIFGERLHNLRVKAGYKNRSEFGDAIGYKEGSIKKWETGNTYPPVDVLLTICETLNCEIDYLLGNMEYRTHDETFICEETGLSPESIHSLKEWNSNPEMRANIFRYTEILDDIIEDHSERDSGRHRDSENESVLDHIGLFLKTGEIRYIFGYGDAHLYTDDKGNEFPEYMYTEREEGYQNSISGKGSVMISMRESEKDEYTDGVTMTFLRDTTTQIEYIGEHALRSTPSEHIKLTDKLIERSLLDQLDDSLKRLKREINKKYAHDSHEDYLKRRKR